MATIPDSGANVYSETKYRTSSVLHGLADEYVKSTYSRWLYNHRKNIFRVKMKAANVLHELISIAKNRRWSKTEHGNNKDAKYGVYHYSSTFVYPVMDHYGTLINVRAFDCDLVMLNASDGKKYLYDIVELK